jgi:uncharacterized delta-60 repeat protein
MPLPRRRLGVLAVSIAAALLGGGGVASAAPLDRDPAFGSAGIVRTGGAAGGQWSALQALPGGGFVAAGQVAPDRVAVARYTAEGTLDTTFAADQPTPGVLVSTGQGATTPADVLVLGDGRILVGATTSTPGAKMLVTRITALGHVDPTFGTAGVTTVNGGSRAVLGGLARQSSGAIILAGRISTTTPTGLVVRLSADGAVDGTFGGGGLAQIQLDGAGTQFEDVAVDASDRILVTGAQATATAGHGRLVVARLTAQGVLDATYGVHDAGYASADLSGAPAASYDVDGRRIALSPDGHALIAATAHAAPGTTHLVGLARFAADGTPDAGFGAGGTATQDISPSHVADLADLAPLPGGGFAVTGRMTVGPAGQVAVAGYHADGTPDATLNPGHGALSNTTNIVVGDGGDDRGGALALLPSGRLLVAGSTTTSSGETGHFIRLGGGAGQAPIAQLTATWPHTVAGRPVRPGQTVTFDASASSDPDGTVASYAWDLDGDGHTDHTGPTATMAYILPGPAGVLLTVTDDSGLQATTGTTLNVEGDHDPGVAIIEPAAAPKAGKAFTLTALAGDSDGSVVSYAWDLDGNGSFETSTGATSSVSTRSDVAGPLKVGVLVTDDEGATATATDTIAVGEGPCAENPVLHLAKAVIVTQGTAQAGAGCFHAVTADKAGVRTTTYTTTGHFRVNGLEVDTLGASKAVLVFQRKIVVNTVKKTTHDGETLALKLTAPNVHVEGTSQGTDFAFRDGSIAWDLSGATIGGFKVDPNAGIGGLPLKVSGEPALHADGTSTLDVSPGTPPELLGKTPSKAIHATFGPSANASALGAFSFDVDTIPLGVITLGPVHLSYDGAGRWDISAKASMAVPVPTTLEGKLTLIKGAVKSVDLQFHGAITAGPILITSLGLSIDFGPKVEANPNCVAHVGLEDITPYEGWDLLDKLIPGYKDYVLAHDGPNQVLFHQLFQDYHTPNFALCGHVELSVAKVISADVGFGFARYPAPLPNVFFFHGGATIVDLIHATIDAEITTEGYVHFNAQVSGGYPEQDPWIGWKLGFDFEYFKQQFNAEAYAKINIVPLDFTAGAQLLASNKGVVACLTIGTPFGDWHPGGGAKWGHGPKLYLFGCDVADYKVVIQHALSGDLVIGPPVHGAAFAARAGRVPVVDRVPAGGRGTEATFVRLAGARPSVAARRRVRARAAQAGPEAVEMPAGLPGTVLGFKGAGGAPHVVLHGPGGETIDSGTGNAPAQGERFAALKNPTTEVTEIVIAKPAAGRWTVEVAADSARLVEVLRADGIDATKVTGTVGGAGHRRTLRYAVKGLRAGEHVDFAEVGAAAGSIIGRVAADGTGTLPFAPADGSAGTRAVQAIVTGADGFIRDRLKLGTYKAPSATRPATVRRLTLRKAGRRLVLSWPRDATARTIQVDVRTSTGLDFTKIVKRPRLSIAAPPAGTRLAIVLTPTSRTGVAGKPARFARRVAAPKHKRR